MPIAEGEHYMNINLLYSRELSVNKEDMNRKLIGLISIVLVLLVQHSPQLSLVIHCFGLRT